MMHAGMKMLQGFHHAAIWKKIESRTALSSVSKDLAPVLRTLLFVCCGSGPLGRWLRTGILGFGARTGHAESGWFRESFANKAGGHSCRQHYMVPVCRYFQAVEKSLHIRVAAWRSHRGFRTMKEVKKSVEFRGDGLRVLCAGGEGLRFEM